MYTKLIEGPNVLCFMLKDDQRHISRSSGKGRGRVRTCCLTGDVQKLLLGGGCSEIVA